MTSCLLLLPHVLYAPPKESPCNDEQQSTHLPLRIDFEIPYKLTVLGTPERPRNIIELTNKIVEMSVDYDKPKNGVRVGFPVNFPLDLMHALTQALSSNSFPTSFGQDFGSLLLEGRRPDGATCKAMLAPIEKPGEIVKRFLSCSRTLLSEAQRNEAAAAAKKKAHNEAEAAAKKKAYDEAVAAAWEKKAQENWDRIETANRSTKHTGTESDRGEAAHSAVTASGSEGEKDKAERRCVAQ